MATVSITQLTTNQQNVNATEINNLVVPLLNEFNGSIDNANIKAAAAIAWTKINSTGQVTNSDIASTAAIAFSKLATLTDGNILVGNGSDTAASVAVSGDVTLDNTGATTVTDLTIASEAQGDILYRGASSWTRLAKGTANQLIKMNSGATAPEWITGTVKDYGSSTSSSTAKSLSAIMICYGVTGDITAGSTASITNLPFSSSSSYRVSATFEGNFWSGTDQTAGTVAVTFNSASQFTLRNTDDQTHKISWIAIGT